MAFSYKEAYRVGLQEPDAVIDNMMIPSYADNVTLNLVTLSAANMEVKAEADNVTLLVPFGGTGFFLVL